MASEDQGGHASRNSSRDGGPRDCSLGYRCERFSIYLRCDLFALEDEVGVRIGAVLSQLAMWTTGCDRKDVLIFIFGRPNILPDVAFVGGATNNDDVVRFCL